MSAQTQVDEPSLRCLLRAVSHLQFLEEVLDPFVECCITDELVRLSHHLRFLLRRAAEASVQSLLEILHVERIESEKA